MPDDWLDRYEGVFDAGPAKFKEQRRERLIELGLIDGDDSLAPVFNFPAWLESHKKPWAERDDAERNKVVAPNPMIAVNLGITYEGPCNWWCGTKFGFPDTMLNPKRRKRLFAGILALIVLGGFALVRRRRKKRAV